MFTIESIYDTLKSKFSELQNINKDSIVKLGVLDSLFSTFAFILNSIVKYVEVLFLNSFVRTSNNLYFLIQKAIEFRYFPRYKLANSGYVIFFPNDLPTTYEEALEYKFKIFSKIHKNFLYTKAFYKEAPYVIVSEHVLNRDVCFGAATLASELELGISQESFKSKIEVSGLGTVGKCFIKVKDPLFNYVINTASTIFFVGSTRFTNVYNVIKVNYITDISINQSTYKIYEILFSIPFEERAFVQTESVSIYKTYVLFNSFKLQILNGDLHKQDIFVRGLQNEEIELPIENLSLQIFDLYYQGVLLNRFNYEVDEYLKNLPFPLSVGYAIFPFYTYKGIKIKFSNGVYSDILPPNSVCELYYLTVEDSRLKSVMNLYEKFDIADSDLTDYCFYNITPIIGYKDFENIDELKHNILWAHNDALYTTKQYEQFLASIPFVAKAKVYKEVQTLISYGGLSVFNYYIIVVPRATIPVLSIAQIVYILSRLEKYKALNDSFFIALPYLVFPNLKIKLKLYNDLDFENVKAKVLDSLSRNFYYENSDLGKSFYYSSISKMILDASPNIEYVDVDIEAKFYLMDFNSFTYIKELKIFSRKNVLMNLGTFELYFVVKKDFIFYPPLKIADISNHSAVYADLKNFYNTYTTYQFSLNMVFPNIFPDTTSSSGSFLQYDSNQDYLFTLQISINLDYQPFPDWYKLSELPYFPMAENIPNGYFFYIKFKFCKAILDQNSNNIVDIALENDLLAANDSVFIASYFNSSDFDIRLL